MDKKMKKNKALRAAGGLFVATMLTTSVVSGTYAKYVTEGSAEATARVAMFGVEITADGELFSETYLKTDNTPGPTGELQGAVLSVESSNGNKVVAPGTKNEQGLTISVSGKPEVMVRLEVDYDKDSTKNIFLKNGSYPDMTTEKHDTVYYDLGEDYYYPIVYKLQIGESTYENLKDLNAVGDSLKTYFQNKTYGPNKDKDLKDQIGNITLTWEWKFEQDDTAKYDRADTLLGDIAADEYSSFTMPEDFTGTEDTDYSINTNFDLKIKVVQVD